MDLIAIIREMTGNVAVLFPLLIIALGIGAAFELFFPRERLSMLFGTQGLPGSLMAAAGSVLHPATSGGKIPIAARFRQEGGRLLPTLAFLVAGSALSLPGILLTLGIGWKIAAIRILATVLFGTLVAFMAHRRLYERLKVTAPADWKTACEPDFCDIRPEPEDWEKAYPFHAFGRILLFNARILIPWFFLGLVIAAIFSVWLAPSSFSGLFGRWWSPLLAALGGLPFFFVAGSDVPIVQVLLAKGVPLPSVISFMMAAPVVNLPVYMMLKRWLGRRSAVMLLLTAWIGAAMVGWIATLGVWVAGKF
ncbi:MAG: permease [Candidatus Aquicultorales bacterium]